MRVSVSHFSCGWGMSEFVRTRAHPAKVSAWEAIDFDPSFRFNIGMKKLIPAILAATPLLFQPALAQTRLTPKVAASHPDNCAPIGRTANGELVYSMKCENLPAPPPPPQARIEETAPPPPPPPPQETRTGVFGWSFDRRQPDQ
jgi:hypothetical protein